MNGLVGTNPVVSDEFVAVKRSTVPGKRVLTLEGPLTAILGPDSLPVAQIAIVPPALDALDTFELRLDADGYDGVTYVGFVDVTDAAGSHLESVRVWVIVP